MKKLLLDRELVKLVFFILLISSIIILVEGLLYFSILVLMGLIISFVLPLLSKGFDFVYDKFIDGEDLC